MAAEPVDYELVLADLEARRAAFNTAIDTATASIRQILVLMTGAGLLQVNGRAGESNQADSQGYVGLGLTDAAKKYLRSVKQKRSNKDIADGLENAGYLHTSKNFSNTIGTALWRAEQDGDADLFRQGRYWLLSEWLPGGRKPRKSSSELPEEATETPAPPPIDVSEVEPEEGSN